jgi:hypothetical protein
MYYDATFFQVQEGSIPETAVLELKWGDMCDITGNFMAIEDLAVRVGIGMDLEKLRMLAKGYHNARKKYFTENDPILPVADFFNKFKKGSRAFRNVLSGSKLIPKPKNCPIRKFAETVNTNCPEPEVIRKINARWCAQYYLVDIKTFLFKFYHNTLGVNARVAHFNPERSPACFFCEKKIILPAPRETMSHFFWDCPLTYTAVFSLCTKFITIEVDKNLFFYGTDANGKFSIQLQIFFDLVRFSLWQMKLRKRLPNEHNLAADLQYHINIVAGINSKVGFLLNECQIFRRHRDGE